MSKCGHSTDDLVVKWTGKSTESKDYTTKMSKRRGKNLGSCNDCDVPFKDGDSWIQCRACCYWLHRKCCGLNDVQFDAMVETSKQQDAKKKNSLMFFCTLCDGTVTDILSNIQKYKKMDIELKKVRNEIDTKIEAFNTRLTKCETSQNQTVTLAERVKKTEQKLTKATPVADIEEEREIERRKSNLILHGIPEPTSKDLEDKLEEEYAYICEAYQKTVNFERDHIKDMFRLGAKQEDKTRPLLIKFHDEDSKSEVLKASGDLKLKIDHEIIKVFASNDMTQKQRNEIKKLREELKARKDRGEKDIGIRGNKVVKLQLFRDRQANRTRVIWASSIKKRGVSKQTAGNEEDDNTEESR